MKPIADNRYPTIGQAVRWPRFTALGRTA